MHREQMKKDVRQNKILSLIRTRKIATQDELTDFLERAGLTATQSSISRDLDELGVVKYDGYYTLPRSRNGASARGLLSLDMAGDVLIVAKCEPGLASSVAVDIDGARVPEIVGTLAGEDTVFIAVGDRKAQHNAIKKIWGLFR
jgi:transcriptional regulator of arginine metabolism